MNEVLKQSSVIESYYKHKQELMLLGRVCSNCNSDVSKNDKHCSKCNYKLIWGKE